MPPEARWSYLKGVAPQPTIGQIVDDAMAAIAIRGIDAQITHGDSFHNDQHPDLKADYVLANPPFNDSDWRGELLRNDKRWVFGTPPAGNANFEMSPIRPLCASMNFSLCTNMPPEPQHGS